ncbi:MULTISPECIES: hypothetical protein [unclassified Pseudomonas]|uniref:hypothetical protein n=1 Tax=unclassified Pseudomonas TaxID=196821 RepID=UPI002AC9354A|nr:MULTISPECIES: hypothetical protein [unclassified Pseudomonas]MEB0044154.1 hypothetical protein [Pseudomonas sp. Dout3]MEB0094909.1 hypothetical protein [Pseudomonas sp. DC1.2]WPX59732.1 hypothetical protein RHM68_03540 [Pseudomonas sp. DC1.2]
MERTALGGLFICAALLASPVFAADNNLCTAKVQELRNKVSSLPATSDNITMEVKRMQASAEAAAAKHDNDKCVSDATQALSLADQLHQ